MNDAFRTTVSSAQGMRLLSQRKDARGSWPEHLLYLVAMGSAANLSDDMIVESAVLHVSPELKNVLMAKYDARRLDHLEQAEELAQFAQLMESTGRNPSERPVPVTNSVVVDAGTAGKRCFSCNEVGHLKHSGSSRHLVGDLKRLEDAKECTSTCVLPDNELVQVTHIGSVTLNDLVNGRGQEVKLTNVYYAPKLARDLLSYGELEKRGCRLVYKDGKRYVERRADQQVIFEVKLRNNVLVVDTTVTTFDANTESGVRSGRASRQSTRVSGSKGHADGVSSAVGSPSL
ncbi:TPA: hypothetical protein N0F65_008735 [Lagenidium giganteum]|uniref:Retrovirus-related Pol polyprotein from transposon TNT 1-94-like beta-barrel domain-containing protein n=1 Tax=Lagenidium giganteum TaxID=4803 RepID=A0AAV2Z2Y7_9STRA|nr:TPA: hypothetical protein N0F65_008735 [Lagenidium giganteum]